MRETSSGCKFCRACARARLPDAGNNLATWNGHGICFIWKGDRIDRTPPGSGSFRGEFASGARSPETCRAWQTGRHAPCHAAAYVRARTRILHAERQARLAKATSRLSFHPKASRVHAWDATARRRAGAATESRARGGCVACAGGPAGRLLRRRAGAYGTGRALASTGPGIASLCLLAAASCRVHLDDG